MSAYFADYGLLLLKTAIIVVAQVIIIGAFKAAGRKASSADLLAMSLATPDRASS